MLAAAQARASAVHPELAAFALNLRYESETRLDTLSAYKRQSFGTSVLPPGQPPAAITADSTFDLHWIQSMLIVTQRTLDLTTAPKLQGMKLELFKLGHIIYDENVAHQTKLRAFAQQWYGVSVGRTP